MRGLHLDIFAGISGDMILGSLIGCGVDLAQLTAELARMPVPRFELTAEAVARGEMTGTKIHFQLPHEHAHRHLSDIEALLDQGGYDDPIRRDAGAVFRRIAEAESRIHGIDIDEVHFHEVGAMDSILDVTGAIIGFHLLGVQQLSATSVPLGRGTVETDHGTLPVPAPATLEILKGVPCRPGLEDGEVTTPTGAAIVAELAKHFGDMPAASPLAIGYGAGSRQGKRVPNLLRTILFETGETRIGEVACLEANLDDMNPELFGYVMERLFEAGALDVYMTPIQMKKNRPGTLLSVLCRPQEAERFRDIVVAETPTLGVRSSTMARWELDRQIVEIETRFGSIRVKQAGKKLAPEFEDCAQAARKHQIPIGEVYEEATRRAREET